MIVKVKLLEGVSTSLPVSVIAMAVSSLVVTLCPLAMGASLTGVILKLTVAVAVL